MYNQSSILIALVLLILMVIAIEAGYRFGYSSQVRVSESYKQHVDAVQTSLLGILALIIAFTFSISIARYDSRSNAEVDEANAIGTAYLRSDLLPMPMRSDMQKLLREYVDARISASVPEFDQASLRLKATQLQNNMWHQATAAVEQDPRPVTTGLFVQSLNELIDSYGRRIAIIDRHVPEAVLVLLSIAFIITSSVIGYTVGITSYRPSFVSYVMVGLIVLVVFLIIDLDHPRRGLVLVSQQSLIELQTSISTK